MPKLAVQELGRRELGRRGSQAVLRVKQVKFTRLMMQIQIWQWEKGSTQEQ